MIRPGIGVHEHDGKTADAPIIDSLKIGFYGRCIQGTNHCQAVTGDPLHDFAFHCRGVILLPQDPQALVRFNDLPVQNFGFFDLQVKNPGTVLVSDLKNITESPGHHQGAGRAFSFQQGVGGHGGPHANPFNPVGFEQFFGYGLAGHLFQDAPDSFTGCVRIVPGIFG